MDQCRVRGDKRGRNPEERVSSGPVTAPLQQLWNASRRPLTQVETVQDRTVQRTLRGGRIGQAERTETAVLPQCGDDAGEFTEKRGSRPFRLQTVAFRCARAAWARRPGSHTAASAGSDTEHQRATSQRLHPCPGTAV